MLQIESILKNNDNSGIMYGKIIHIYKSSDKKTTGAIKDKILIASQKSDTRKQPKKKVTKAIITKTRKNIKRKNGHYIKFGQAGMVVLYENDSFKGTKIRGPIAAEIRYQPNTEIITTAKAII